MLPNNFIHILYRHYYRRLKGSLTAYLTGSQTLSGWVVLASAILFLLGAAANAFTAQLRFIWHAFIAPIGSADQRERLEKVLLLAAPFSGYS